MCSFADLFSSLYQPRRDEDMDHSSPVEPLFFDPFGFDEMDDSYDEMDDSYADDYDAEEDYYSDVEYEAFRAPAPQPNSGTLGNSGSQPSSANRTFSRGCIINADNWKAVNTLRYFSCSCTLYKFPADSVIKRHQKNVQARSLNMNHVGDLMCDVAAAAMHQPLCAARPRPLPRGSLMATKPCQANGSRPTFRQTARRARRCTAAHHSRRPRQAV